jgi:hypothetical protein
MARDTNMLGNDRGRFDLKLENGSTVTWVGCDGEDAARRFVNSLANKKGLAVVAWRKTREARVCVASPAGRPIREEAVRAHG